MNTPLNDVLKPCPFCGDEAYAENDFSKQYWVQCANDHTDGILYQTSQEAIAAWNARTTTPESSNSTASNGAAQGAVTREALLHLICDYTGNRINLPNFTIEELEDFARGVLSVGWKPADDSILLCVACSEPTGAQPSDATAQPRVDLTDERASFETYYAAENMPLESDWFKRDAISPEAYDYLPADDAWRAWEHRALLANTAQGKPEQCPTCRGNDADAPCAYPSCGMTGCLRDKRLAAKKG